MKKRILAGFIALCAALGAQAAGVFSEVGDAGGPEQPQDVTGRSIVRIEGTIGGDDLVDAFRFHFRGGRWTTLAKVSDSNGNWHDLPFALFREGAGEGEPCTPTDPCEGNGVLDLPDHLFVAGNYVLSACYPPNPCLNADPPFYFEWTGGDGQPVSIDAPIPEPASLALLAAGLALLPGLASARAAPRRRLEARRPS